MNVQMINQDGKPEWAVLPYNEYLKLVEKAEMLQDINDYDQAKAEIEKNGTEFIPAEIAFSLAEGANPIKTWREYRGIGQNELAQRVGISVPYLSQLESGKRKGTLKVLSTLAGELHLLVEDLLTE